ncbi:hypothetical protein EMIT048CA2_60102 [Pseudomonas chlororaphis]
MIRALFPGSGVADFRRAQQAGTVASIAMLGNHFVWSLRTTATGGNSDFHTLAFLPLDADLANRLEALGNIVVGRSLSADSPEGQYGCWCSQHFHN